MYVLFSLEKFPKGHLNKFTAFVQAKSLVEQEDLLKIISLEVLNLF